MLGFSASPYLFRAVLLCIFRGNFHHSDHIWLGFYPPGGRPGYPGWQLLRRVPRALILITAGHTRPGFPITTHNDAIHSAATGADCTGNEPSGTGFINVDHGGVSTISALLAIAESTHF